MKTRIEYAGIALISGLLLLINCTWGLPNQTRLDLIGGKSVLQANLQAINQAKNKAKQIGTANLTYQERLHFSVREFLISPFAGDDNFTLNAIRNLNPYKLKLDPHFYMYGGGFIYTGALFLQLSAWLGFTKLIPQADYYLQNPQALGNIFAILRIMVVVFATAGLTFAYHLARIHFGRTTALLTTAILISTPLVHQASRTIEPHIFVLPFFLVAFYFIVLFAQHTQAKHLFLSALFSGFSVGIQALSIYISIAFLVTLIYHYNTHHQNICQIICSILVYGTIAAIAGLALNPYYVLNFDGFMNDFTRGTGNQLLNTFKPWAPFQLSAFLLGLFFIALIYHLLQSTKDIFTKLALSCTITSIPIYIFIANY
ncbi:MAG: ArnT family glycosyltransferase, partial [Candidatus Latescibacterota bacterium]